MPTPGGILYLALKFAIPSSDSTKLYPFLKRVERTKKIEKRESGAEEEKNTKKRKICGKTKGKGLGRLTERREVSSVWLFVFKEAQMR